MRRTIAIFAVGLACAVAMISACAAAENNAEHQNSAGSPIVVAAETNKPTQSTEADKKKLSDQIQERYKPKMHVGSGKCGGTAQIAACSVSCSAACIFSCSPYPLGNTPWSSTCHSCVDTCMDKCTGCGS
ncbi:MAG: hypothetical protein ACLP0B_06435 [Steroidobacteraceae bacterium]|jgi:hypothetical protein